ncbi:hypothetical protein BC835DRAFT_1305274 [Cytidiella melzeri]|nr:hypothetical protein BC835DRAFT_1305274 [Cytidiella melzeri]
MRYYMWWLLTVQLFLAGFHYHAPESNTVASYAEESEREARPCHQVSNEGLEVDNHSSQLAVAVLQNHCVDVEPYPREIGKQDKLLIQSLRSRSRGYSVAILLTLFAILQLCNELAYDLVLLLERTSHVGTGLSANVYLRSDFPPPLFVPKDLALSLIDSTDNALSILLLH